MTDNTESTNPEPEAANPPAMSAYVATAIVEWSRRYGRKSADGQAVGDTAEALIALADTAGELVRRLPSRGQRRLARAEFEKRFRNQIVTVGGDRT